MPVNMTSEELREFHALYELGFIRRSKESDSRFNALVARIATEKPVIDALALALADALDRCEELERDKREALASLRETLRSLKTAVAFINSSVSDPDITPEMWRNYLAYQESNPDDAIEHADTFLPCAPTTPQS